MQPIKVTQQTIQMKSLITTFTLVIVIAQTLFSQTMVSDGEITGFWQISESPFIVEGDVTVPVGGKLTIDPGVEVLFSGPFNFEVLGRLDATGTVEDTIFFGMSDTTGFSTEAYEGWLGMVFLNLTGTMQEPSLIDYAKIEFSANNAVSCYNSSLLIQNTKIQYNKGYGLNLIEATDIIIENTHLSYNHSGGMRAQSSAPQMSDFVVSHNNGSGIRLVGNVFNNSQANFQHGLITNNNSTNSGGGVYVGMDAYITMLDITILSNTAFLGGGIHCDMGGIVLDNSNVSFNVAEYGGGININGQSTCSINNTLVADNQAFQAGGGIRVSNSNLQINGSTLAHNMASLNSGGIEYIMIGNKVNTISNSILWGNFPQEIKTSDAIPEIRFSDIMGGYEGYEVMDSDPLFVDAENNIYQLQWDSYPSESGFKSPAIDNGDPLSEYDPDGTIADLGAFYFEQTIFTSTNAMNHHYELSIFPNPAAESFNIRSEKNISKLQISNLSGQVIKVIENVDLNTQVNISDVKKGIYLLNIYFENSEVGTETLIKN